MKQKEKGGNLLFVKYWPTVLSLVRSRQRFVLYMIIMGMVMVLSSFQTTIYAKLLSPEFLGYYAVAMNVASYGIFLQFGLISGLGRELPIALGNGDLSYSAKMVGETTVVVSILILAGLLIYALLIMVYPFSDPNIRGSFILSGMLVLPNMLFQLIILRLRSERRTIAFPIVFLSQKMAFLIIGGISCFFFRLKALSMQCSLSICSFFSMSQKIILVMQIIGFPIPGTRFA